MSAVPAPAYALAIVRRKAGSMRPESAISSILRSASSNDCGRERAGAGSRGDGDGGRRPLTQPQGPARLTPTDDRRSRSFSPASCIASSSLRRHRTRHLAPRAHIVAAVKVHNRLGPTHRVA